MPVLEGHAVVPHVHRLRTWLSAASGCGLLRDATVGCCSYNTGEDSTIKCTMTQFEDQFSTIKPDGIQVRCHKVLVFFCCTGLRTTLSDAISETAANVF
uniref:Uncharacterized protein n=1 Tax=Oryza rufipogon TaxID=4529 RepID=A0A0E0R7W2_ORYRU